MIIKNNFKYKFNKVIKFIYLFFIKGLFDHEQHLNFFIFLFFSLDHIFHKQSKKI